MSDYTAGEKGALTLVVIGSGFVRMAIEASALYYTYSRGHGIAFGFGALLVIMWIWTLLVNRPLHARLKEVFAGELERANMQNTTWKDLAFAVVATAARRRGAR